MADLYKKALENDERKMLETPKRFLVHSETGFSELHANLHSHDFIEIFILLSGSVTYVIEKGKYELKDFDIVVVPPHVLHELVVKDKSVDYKRIVIWVYPQYLKDISSEQTNLSASINHFLKKNNNLIRNPEYTLTIKPIAEKIAYLDKERPYGYDLLIENAFRELFITSNTFAFNDETFTVKPEGNDVVLSIISYIEEHLSNELSLEEIAQEMKMDTINLSYLFSKEMGTTLHQYIIKKRLNQAKLMLDMNQGIDMVIKSVGFKDKSHFIQAFKKEYGITPHKYRMIRNVKQK